MKNLFVFTVFLFTCSRALGGACEALPNKDTFFRELEKRRPTHKRLTASLASARAVVDLQDRLMKQAMKDLEGACQAEKEIGRDLSREVTAATRANKDCALDLALARVYFKQYELAGAKLNAMNEAGIRRRDLDLDGNEGTRAVLKDLQAANKQGEFTEIGRERNLIWESSGGGMRTVAGQSRDSAPIFMQVSSLFQDSEKKVSDFREQMSSMALTFAQRHQRCRPPVTPKPATNP